MNYKYNIKMIKKPNSLIHFTKYEIIIFILLMLLIITSPIIFTRVSFLGVSFDETGEIGDTIGGLTAPFVNLLAAFLVYKSFSAQIKANFIQQRNHDSQMKLIRKEQALNTLIYLFKEIETTVIESDGKFHQGSINGIIALNRDYTALVGRHPNNTEYLKKTKIDHNRVIGRTIHVLHNNIRHLLRFIRHLESYMSNHSDEKNVADFTGFYIAKINDMISTLKYSKVLDEELIQIMTNSYLDENNYLQLNNAKLRYEELRNKLHKLLISTGIF